MSGLEALVLPILVKYLVNIVNVLEDRAKANIPNWSKQATVVILNFIIVSVLPHVGPLAPIVKPWLEQASVPLATALASVATVLLHHLIEIVVLLQSRLQPKP